MRRGTLAMVALGLLVCMPLAAQRNKGGGAGIPMGGPMGGHRAVSSSPMMPTHNVTNRAGSITRTVTRSAAGTTRTMVNTEGNKSLTVTHSKLAGSRPVLTRTFTHVRKTSRVKTAHHRVHRTKARHASHSKSGR